MSYVILYDEKAFFDGERPGPATLEALAENFKFINFTDDLPETAEVLINLHGKYFPKAMWERISAALDRGMSYISLSGGAPLSFPVRYENGRFLKGVVQTAYHRKFYIENSIEIPEEYQKSLSFNKNLNLLEAYENLFTPQDTQGFIVRFTHENDTDEHGTSGPIDGAVFPLLRAYDGRDRQMAAPVVLLEYYRQELAGSRHVFINQDATRVFWEKGGAALLKHLADYLVQGAFRFYPAPDYALYYENERPLIRFNHESFRDEKTAQLSMDIKKDGDLVYSFSKELHLSPTESFEQLSPDLSVSAGLYTIECKLTVDGCEHLYHNAFWGKDSALLQEQDEITCNEDYFIKNGEIMPVVGMTYHQSDLHRKFLLLPNPYLWDKDFGQMKKAGVNMIRTGIWTAFRQIMFVDGHPSESSMRAFEALVHTACAHDMPLVFCFFTFVPESWEGENAYLDPDSLRAQKRFISAFVERAENCNLILWDFINEPSVANPDRLWKTRPLGDRFELAKWRGFLRKRFGKIETLQENWRVDPEEARNFASIGLPPESSFNDEPASAFRVNGFPVHDYRIFASEIFNQWVDELTETVRAKGNDKLLTVGQDESLGTKRPHPFLYQDHVDYVSNHSWWILDGLYKDGIFYKPRRKPCLIQETGIMYVANADARNRRSFEEARSLLERKYGLALGSACAGAVHWTWNTNCHMNDVNEAHIGGLLADGSHKAETEVTYDFGEFMAKNGRFFKNRSPEKVAVVMPFSTNFSIRDYSQRFLASLSRMLGYDLHLGFQVIGEYELDAGMDYDLIFVPSPRILINKAFDALMALAEKGSTLAMSGVFFQDEYFKTVRERVDKLQVGDRVCNAEREEKLRIGDKSYYASYGGNSLAIIDKVCTEDGRNVLKEIKIGKGKVIWTNIPLEVSENYDIVKAFYEYALLDKGIESPVSWNTEQEKGIFIRKLSFEGHNLYVAVSENGQDIPVDIKDGETGQSFRFEIESGRIFVFITDKDGELTGVYRKKDLEIY